MENERMVIERYGEMNVRLPALTQPMVEKTNQLEMKCIKPHTPSSLLQSSNL